MLLMKARVLSLSPPCCYVELKHKWEREFFVTMERDLV